MLLEVPSTELRAYYRGYSVLAMLAFLSIRLCFFSDLLGFKNNALTRKRTHISKHTHKHTHT
jgi:hypothetical protein